MLSPILFVYFVFCLTAFISSLFIVEYIIVPCVFICVYPFPYLIFMYIIYLKKKKKKSSSSSKKKVVVVKSSSDLFTYPFSCFYVFTQSLCFLVLFVSLMS